MSQEQLASSLARATEVVLQFASGSMAAKEFIEAYANFYYYEALDGHEATSAVLLLPKFCLAIELHRRVQTEVVDRLAIAVYSPGQLAEAGRIDEGQARMKALEICSAVGGRALIECLSLPG